jgi:hypothetical protein
MNVSFSLRLPQDLAVWVQDQADSEDRSVNMWLVRLVRQAKADADKA